ncbi:hypothetical protein RHSIM_Rhsim13G0055600 [Rhododendron simsii]|uniref:F-box/LRR-repeat protein 15-like leucin rich repeat domain-containing protein n=1 Tax=Rhododendron simsii TaxID=118357 RepID=A0A834G310_RHOSS|nr:hypothetical protein RHSIM_Rhsim13G0055600 [Rhododendron simsii]
MPKFESGSRIGPTSVMHLPDDCLYFIFQRLHCKLDRDLPSVASNPEFQSLLNRFPQLQSFSLSKYKFTSNSLLSQLQPYGSKLHALNLSHCYKLTDYGLYLVAIGCPSLTDISLCLCNVTDVGFRALSKSCLALKDVKLLRWRLISDHGIREFSQNCKQLRFVCVSMCQGVTDVGFKGCSKTLTCLDATALVGIVWELLGPLDFHMCKSVNDETIVAVSKGCPLLQEWSLISCHEVKLSGWESIGSNCCNLKRLLVNGCPMEVFKKSRSDVEIKEEDPFSIAPAWVFDDELPYLNSRMELMSEHVNGSSLLIPFGVGQSHFLPRLLASSHSDGKH